MGVWGAGLYSGDLATDLRATVSAVSRLPYDGDALLEILCGVEPAAANDSGDEDHTTFWLVVADQFEKRGIACDTARQKAIPIIDSGSDTAMLAKLGMGTVDLAKRQTMLSELRVRLTSPRVLARRGPILKKPQPFLMEIGDVFAYPTDEGKCINSYAQSKEKIPGGWEQNSWSAMVIVDRGHAFDFLVWYRPLTVLNAMPHRPLADSLRAAHDWVLRRPGTCSTVHFKRLELEKIDSLPIDNERLRRAFPKMQPGTYQAINDISIANELSVAPAYEANLKLSPNPTITSLDEILFSGGPKSTPGLLAKLRGK